MLTRFTASAAFDGDLASFVSERPAAISRVHAVPASAETIFTAIMLFYSTGAIVPLLTGTHDSLAGSTIQPIDVTIKAILYAISFFFMLRCRQRILRACWSIRWVLLPVMLAYVSTAWSQDPLVTLRASVVLTATTAFGVYFGIRYSVPQQLRLLAWTFGLVVVASFLFSLLLPTYGIDEGAMAGDWRGVFIQKNGLAQAMVLAFLVFLFIRPKRRPSLVWLALGACLALLFLSVSETGVLVLVALLLSLPFYRLIRARFTLLIPVLLGLGLLVLTSWLILSTNSAAVFRVLDRSPDMTGRTELWVAVLHAVSKRPWLGYGFSAFWQGMKGESGIIIDAVGWPAGYSHNGFLEVMVQLGILGVASFLIGYFVLWRRAIAFASTRSQRVTRWLGTYLAFMLLYNLTECSILEQNTIYWMLYIAVAVSLYKTRARFVETETRA